MTKAGIAFVFCLTGKIKFDIINFNKGGFSYEMGKN